ncbi:MAG: DUF5996 family protein [Gaiellales bacterium]
MAERARSWPSLDYPEWSATCDTLHAHTQVVGKIATALAPPQPQLQHGALRLTARGWETLPLPAPDGSGAFVVAIDLHAHEVRLEHSDGREGAVSLTPDRPVGEVTRAVLEQVERLAGGVEIHPDPQEVWWTIPLDEDTEHASYDTGAVARYFAAATRAALVLAEFRAPFRGRSSPVNAWWGSFDLAVNMFSGVAVDPPGEDFIRRNSMDAQVIEIGWWPGDPRNPRSAFYGYAFPAPDGLADTDVSPGRFDSTLGEFLLDWNDALSTPDPHATALEFARSVTRHACEVCDWDPAVASTIHGDPPPVS